MKKPTDVCIIGAGIAGLSCARTLADHGISLTLLTDTIGGRIKTNADGKVNYGAFFVCEDYTNFLPYATRKKRIRLRDFCFHDKNNHYVLLQPKLLAYIDQFTHILTHLYRFRQALRQFRKDSQIRSQKTVIEQSPYLHHLYRQNAHNFVHTHHLHRGTQTYLCKALNSTTFSRINEMNAFSFLQFLIPLITPIYTFTFEQKKFIAPFEDNIILDRVNQIDYKNNRYTVKTTKKNYTTTTLVLATDITWSAPQVQIKQYNTPVTTHMLHVSGTLKEELGPKRYHLFHPASPVQAIADLLDGTYLCYYKEKPPSLSTYFKKPHVLAHQFWNPAGTINGHHLIECNQANNLYLIGDYNVAGLEETFITGRYAAHQILQATA